MKLPYAFFALPLIAFHSVVFAAPTAEYIGQDRSTGAKWRSNASSRFDIDKNRTLGTDGYLITPVFDQFPVHGNIDANDHRNYLGLWQGHSFVGKQDVIYTNLYVDKEIPEYVSISESSDGLLQPYTRVQGLFAFPKIEKPEGGDYFSGATVTFDRSLFRVAQDDDKYCSFVKLRFNREAEGRKVRMGILNTGTGVFDLDGIIIKSIEEGESTYDGSGETILAVRPKLRTNAGEDQRNIYYEFVDFTNISEGDELVLYMSSIAKTYDGFPGLTFDSVAIPEARNIAGALCFISLAVCLRRRSR